MATRFYLSSTATPTQTPSFSAWTRATEALRRSMSPTKDGSAITSTTIWANGAAAADESALARQFISAPLSAGIAFSTSDTIKAQVRCMESAANDNINRAPIAVKVYSQDGTTLRATLLGLGHVGPNTTEWPASLTNKTVADGDALTAGYTTVLGDILVVELGGQVSGAGGTSVTGTMSFGSASATDLGENETDTAANNPWFEISRTVGFATIVLAASPAVLTLSTFAPTVKFTTNLTPAMAARTTTAFAAKLALSITPATRTLTATTFAPTFGTPVTPAPASLAATRFAPSLSLSTTPAPAVITSTGFTPSLHNRLTPSAATLNSSLFTPSLNFATLITPTATALTIVPQSPSLKYAVTPATNSLTVTPSTPSLYPPKIIFLDPGGDAVQMTGYFNAVLGSVSFDTAQKVVGVGSWKCDATINNVAAKATYSNVLGAARRVSVYFRYDDLPDTSATVEEFGLAASSSAYSGGGFTGSMSDDDGVYVTATPARNSGQGHVFSDLGFDVAIAPAAVIDSVKIIYERKYDVDTSIGISRVKWRVDSAEGPNHDNTAMPLTDTVVEVDITGDIAWERQYLLDGRFEVIAEARRGDTDTEHTQSWDHVKVEVEYHEPVIILQVLDSFSSAVCNIGIIQRGSEVALRFTDGTGASYDGIDTFPPDEFHRISFSYVLHEADNLDINVFLDGVPQLLVSGASTATSASMTSLECGWVSIPGASRACWLDQLYVDEGDNLEDAGNRLSTAKLPATVNVDDFDTTGGTGTVSERPPSLDNYRAQVATAQVHQNYTLEAADDGDVDISGETFVGYMGWLIAKKVGPLGGTFGLTLNGNTSNLVLATSPTFHKLAVTDVNYPDDAVGIGLRSATTSHDAYLYECGAVVVYEGPANPDLLLERQEVADETLDTIIDDLRAAPPDSYELCYQCDEFDGSLTIDIYSVESEGSSPQFQGTMGGSGGTGRLRITPGIEVQIVVTVTGVTMLQIWRRTNVD